MRGGAAGGDSARARTAAPHVRLRLPGDPPARAGAHVGRRILLADHRRAPLAREPQRPARAGGAGEREPSLRARQARDPRRHRALLQTRGEPPAGPVAVLLPGGTRLRDHRRGRPAFPGRGTSRRGRLRAGLPRPGRDRRGAAPGRPGQLLPAQLARRDRAGRVALRAAPLGRTGSVCPLGRGDHGGRGADRPRNHGPLAAGGVRLPRFGTTGTWPPIWATRTRSTATCCPDSIRSACRRSCAARR